MFVLTTDQLQVVQLIYRRNNWVFLLGARTCPAQRCAFSFIYGPFGINGVFSLQYTCTGNILFRLTASVKRAAPRFAQFVRDARAAIAGN